MAFCRVVFPLLVLSIVSCYASKVPVFMWGDIDQSSHRANPLTTFSKTEFEGVLKLELDDEPLTVVFIEETLSVEDFSSKNENGETNYPYLLDNLDNAVYLPSVEDALPAFDEFTKYDNVDHITLTEAGIENEITPTETSNGRFLFIDLKDAREGESRSDLLRRHDAFMQKTLEKLPESLKVIAVYTAYFPSWTISDAKSRARRAVENRAQTYSLDGLALYANSIKLVSGNDSRVLSEITSYNSVFNDTVMNTTVTFDNTSLTLNFVRSGGYWFFDTVEVTVGALSENLRGNEDVFAIMGFSYRCAQHVSFSSVNETRSYTVVFEDLKIQPFFETSNSTQVFGDSFNCIGFFSAPIWAGLFVVFILLLITFYGIMMMLDIRTMDRFDDPKGKTITINAGE